MGDGGGGMDPCECIWGHELAMRRLLNILRNSQSYCTDAECIINDTPARQSNPDHALLMTIFVVVALFMYYFRPRRQSAEGPSKSAFNNSNIDPPPPPTMN
ncbi:unnamed protein product [Callosobruchus maculatus]|uniref:Small integral membrane protein 14 n=1 Tax=Callosobruchus maculatus TaxID=64391 RepID=A0A653D5D1_CALMS|nr:unnamed protein product [Callosobruchus maculatus]